MPLHLLGKKSWNVYNADNVARVKKDEAEHAAREAAEEQRMQEEDAERRLKLLRGESVSPVRPLPEGELEDQKRSEKCRDRDEAQPRKRRRVHGEDDTERDLRYAQEELTSRHLDTRERLVKRKPNDAPLMDAKGNINLFPIEAPKRSQLNKNAEVEAEKKKKEREYEDQYTMRFSNAAGFKEKLGAQPWYHSLGKATPEEPISGKDVWGNEDPGRKQREMKRFITDDPLAMINQGVAGVRQVERERTQWLREKERELRELEEDERRSKRTRRKERDDFRDGGHHRHRRRSGSRHRHRTRSRDRGRDHQHGHLRREEHHRTRHEQ